MTRRAVHRRGRFVITVESINSDTLDVASDQLCNTELVTTSYYFRVITNYEPAMVAAIAIVCCCCVAGVRTPARPVVAQPLIHARITSFVVQE